MKFLLIILAMTGPTGDYRSADWSGLGVTQVGPFETEELCEKAGEAVIMAGMDASPARASWTCVRTAE